MLAWAATLARQESCVHLQKWAQENPHPEDALWVGASSFQGA